ncbi:MAG: DNA topoisomerase, partial [Oscillospiraceae bacterium]|nr:DNA topoisomerase [Oscillospiraceae bacterium]
SIDEAREGHGNKIIVTRYKDGSVSIEDFGRGIPVDYNEREGKFNWELVFCELYAGGKYQNNDGENYEFSLGLNGLGLCATQYSSEYMDAEIHRDGQKFTLHFEKGENVGGLKKEPTNRRQTGSKITWRPDRNVFTDIDISLEYLQETMRRQAVVNPKVLFVLKNQINSSSFESFEYFYEEGIVDYTKELVGEQAMTSVQTFTDERRGRDREDMNDYKVKMSVAFCFSNKLNMIEYYHNSSFLEHGGSPEKAVKSAFVAQIDAYLKQNNRYLKNESKISFQDVEDCLVLVSSSFSTQTSYENQTKKAITNKFIATAMAEFLRHNLEVYFIENPEEAKKIADQVLINKHSREKAERTRLDLKKTLATSNDVMARVEKFVDCRSKDKEKREIYIVEGDSALGSCKQGRDSEFQAIIPVRGKILNCLKAEYDKIFKNDIITDLIKVLGCGVEVKTKSNKDLSMFNLEALRWNKVIICTDADVDGFQIRTLILTMLYRLVPTLIEEGFVYIAESPLFEITTKEKTYFAYNEAEKAEILKRIEGQKFTIQRSKGLGENEAEMMWMTTMNPETRRLIKVMPEDVEETVRVFDLLLGDNLDGRKEFIAEHGGEYLELADIS